MEISGDSADKFPVSRMSNLLERDFPVTKGAALAERMKRRMGVEEHFAKLGHTYRHGPFHEIWEHYLMRPALKVGLKATALYERGVRNALTPEVRRVRLKFANLPPAFDGFRLLHISDLHIDGVDGLAEALACTLRTLEADLCVLTGDYRFEDKGPADEVYPRMETVLKSIRTRHGVFGILGNHDSAEIGLNLDEMGLSMLVNDAIEIEQDDESIWLAGVDDPFAYACHDLDLALEPVDPKAFKILLAHAPEIYDEAAESAVDLYLSGHTHAGQIRFPGIGAIKQNARCPSAYAYGHWRHKTMQGYTSAGVGCSGLPIRYNCPPEVVLIELRRAA